MTVVRALALALSVLVPVAAGAQEQPSWASRALSAFNDTTPVGLLAPGERHPGWKGWSATFGKARSEA